NLRKIQGVPSVSETGGQHEERDRDGTGRERRSDRRRGDQHQNLEKRISPPGCARKLQRVRMGRRPTPGDRLRHGTLVGDGHGAAPWSRAAAVPLWVGALRSELKEWRP